MGGIFIAGFMLGAILMFLSCFKHSVTYFKNTFALKFILTSNYVFDTVNGTLLRILRRDFFAEKMSGKCREIKW